ncbi:MAG: HAMP domain-containing histidine kinase [Bacteroidetes bacterium]|nr:HAMP domain-containing histidine kinase [Bacteroidota bacterium]
MKETPFIDHLFLKIAAIGFDKTDTNEVRAIKNQLVLLAILMSCGGIVWGTLLCYFKIYWAAIIPFGYVVISAFNVADLNYSNRYKRSIHVQIFISMMLPFFLQWMLGGFIASGSVMLWSTLALIGSISLLRGKRVYPWLFLYILLTLFSFWIEPNVKEMGPSILSGDIPLILLLINVTMIVSIVFVLSKIKTDQDIRINEQLRETTHNLKNAKEEAEKSNQLKTIFLGNLSHEVRTPLQGIQGLAELLEATSISEEKRIGFLQLIQRRTKDLQGIIESLLDLASIESGEIRPFVTTVHLKQFLENFYQQALSNLQLKPSAIEFELHLSIPEDSSVKIDPNHLTQVLTNLFSNALKFTEQGSISLQCVKEPLNYRIRISDTGLGINEDEVQHIFKPFRQAHEGLSRSKGGIGLGLSICKEMIEMWDGSIVVNSTIGMGSVFSFTIPIPQKGAAISTNN